MKHELLTRDDFRSKVFARDKGKCVFCILPAADAHHILDRKLFTDGGYYLDNGASVCAEHHMKCETTEISVEEVRSACRIKDPKIPPQLSINDSYDKWGNPVLNNGQRLRGELFENESVQKILGKYLHLFTSLVKYPRTYHLPWSEGLINDDKMISSLDRLQSVEVVVTEKIDGENTTMYNDHIHARSLDSRAHPSRDVVKQIWGKIASDIPDAWRVCGENVYAKHSIFYDNLPSYFLGFNIWNEKNVCLSWDDTMEWFDLLGLCSVPVLYRGRFDRELIHSAWLEGSCKVSEGYVIRATSELSFAEFEYLFAKYVRKNHIQTDEHWMNQQIEKNLLGHSNETL